MSGNLERQAARDVLELVGRSTELMPGKKFPVMSALAFGELIKARRDGEYENIIAGDQAKKYPNLDTWLREIISF